MLKNSSTFPDKFINLERYYFILLPFLTKKRFLDKVGRDGKIFMKRLDKYIDNTDEKNIHDIRTSTRRLHVSF